MGSYLRRKLIALGLALIVVGAFLTFIGIKEARKPTIGQDTPQRLTVAQLAADGPGDNPHIELTEFSGALGYGRETSGQIAGREIWKAVWIALVPKDGTYDQRAGKLAEGDEEPALDTFVLLKSRDVRSESSLERVLTSSVIHGLVVNDVDPLTSEDRTLLRGVYPRADLSRCWIFEHGRGPVKRGSLAKLWIGLLLLVGCGGIAIWIVTEQQRAARRRARSEHARMERRQTR